MRGARSYPNARALLATAPVGGPVSVVNIDAHLDVRPRDAAGRAHSGTPFRQLLEDAGFIGTGGGCRLESCARAL